MYITWVTDPILFEVGPLSVRWYGLLFAFAFMAGFYIIQWMLKREEYPKEWLDSLLIYVMIGTVGGARLGHVFFYQWDYYQNNLLEILQVWKGGLASHGAAIGIIASVWLWSRRVSKKPVLWTLDRVVVTVALSGLFIRVGNFINHEIVGKATNADWGVKFLRNFDDLSYSKIQKVTGMPIFKNNEVDYSMLDKAYDAIATNPEFASLLAEIPNRHPAQLYEAFAYLCIFLTLLGLYTFKKAGEKHGLIFGLFLIGTFGARFIIEFFKADQVAFESEMVLNMGQWLSIPLVLMGLFFAGRTALRPKSAG